MSEYRKIDCVGWWETQCGQRVKVIAIEGGHCYYLSQDSKVVATTSSIEHNLCKHLPDCTGWNWQPESEIEEIDFPDWILPGWDFVTRDSCYDIVVIWNEQPMPKDGEWGHVLGISSDRTLDFVDTSWVPPVPKEGWERAIWKRKQKQDDGWIEWRGGECPVDPGAAVRVQFRGPYFESWPAAGFWRWRHDGNDCDIVAYRIIE